MTVELYIQSLQETFPDAEIGVSEHGQRLLVNGHVMKGFTLHNPFDRGEIDYTVEFMNSIVSDHLDKYGSIKGGFHPDMKKEIKSKPKHSRMIPGYSDMSILAENLGNLHYETLEEFLGHLANKLKEDAQADSERGRKKLSSSLLFAANDVKMAQQNVGNAWQTSKPYMEEE